MELLQKVIGRLAPTALWSWDRMGRGREEGQTLVEYGLILALIAILCVAALTFLKNDITSLFSKVGSDL